MIYLMLISLAGAFVCLIGMAFALRDMGRDSSRKREHEWKRVNDAYKKAVLAKPKKGKFRHTYT